MGMSEKVFYLFEQCQLRSTIRQQKMCLLCWLHCRQPPWAQCITNVHRKENMLEKIKQNQLYEIKNTSLQAQTAAK